eukprot:12649682-Alexandrium_andersonii.AAC.1
MADLDAEGYSCLPSLSGWLAALAASPRLSGPGSDGVPAEVWGQAPLQLKIVLYKAMLARVAGVRQSEGGAWST